MPDDPNRNLDEQLADWARKRREEAGPPFELHPATRKLLHDQAARTFPKKSDEPAAAVRVGVWAMFWPRFALAGGLCVMLAAIVGLLLPSLAKSKSKGQHIALMRQQEKALSADSERDAQTAAKRSGVLVVEERRRSGDESGKSSLAEARPPTASSLAQSRRLEDRVGVETELKDARTKADQPAKAEALSVSERNSQPTLSDKAKERGLAETASPAREPYAEKEQLLLRQRVELSATSAVGATSATTPLARDQKPPGAAPPLPAAAAQVASGGAASNAAAGANFLLNGAKDDALALTRPIRPAADGIASRPTQRAIDGLGTGNVYASYAAVPSSLAAQRFAQVREYRVNFNSPPMPNVLSSFQLVQNGRQMRIVDADGSIYDGVIESLPTEETTPRAAPLTTTTPELKKNSEPEAKGRAATANEAFASQNAFFRVTGTNISLNQRVVFEGNFLTASNPANAITLGAKLTTAPSAAAAVRQGSLQKTQPTLNGLIRGQATIGSSNRIEINAAQLAE